MPEIGQIISHYRITEKLGQGGMGEVFLAHDTTLDRKVALKFLPPGMQQDATAHKRFIREAKSAAALDHPYICHINEVAESKGQDFIAMEYVDGQSLKDRLLQGPLPTEEGLTLAIEVAEALEAAHAKGIIHRDIKPGNVMLTQTGHAKVMDFGLAKQLIPAGGIESQEETVTALTSDGAAVGTLAYMSPEQLRAQDTDARSDIWALGVTIYEMAAGVRPFQGQSGFELTSAILNQAPRPLPSRVPAELGAVIERCLEKEAGKRYQQAGEVRAALEAIRAGTAVPWAAWRYRLGRHRWLMLAAAIVIIAALVVGLDVGGLRGRLSGGAPTPGIDSLAVLPLANLSGDTQQDYIAEGMHDALITNLAHFASLKVIARRSVMRFKGTNTPLRAISQELKVAALITGAVVRSGDRVRVTAQLINPTTEAQLWANSYERDWRDVLSLQNDIVAAITREVKLQLTPQEQARLATARAVNPAAYEAYLKGKFYLNKSTPEGSEKGLAYMQQAIDKDPANPLPYAGLALGYCLIGHGPSSPPDTFARAKAAALKALELGGTLAETETALGQIKLFSDWDWAGAEQAFQRALATNPSFSEAHRLYSWYLFLPGHRNEAIAEMRRAIEVDPLAPLTCADLAWQYWSVGRYDEAVDAARKALELDSNFALGLANLGAVYAERGMYTEAIAAHQKLSAAGLPWGGWPLARTYAQAGHNDEARKILAQLLGEKPKPTGALAVWYLIELYATLGEKDEAFRWLDVAYRDRNTFFPWIRDNPAYAPLRSDPRFQALVDKMHFPK